MEHLSIGTGFGKDIFIGQVINNNDPNQLQMIQVRVPILHDGVTDTDLPWAIPKKLSGVGHYNGASEQSIPLVNSFVGIEFQHGDPHFPMYTMAVLTPANVSPILTVNYPFRYGWALSASTYFYVDQSTKDLQITHNGTTVAIDASGNATITVAGNLDLSVTGNITSSSADWTHSGNVTYNNNVTVLGTLTA